MAAPGRASHLLVVGAVLTALVLAVNGQDPILPPGILSVGCSPEKPAGTDIQHVNLDDCLGTCYNRGSTHVGLTSTNCSCLNLTDLTSSIDDTRCKPCASQLPDYTLMCGSDQGQDQGQGQGQDATYIYKFQDPNKRRRNEVRAVRVRRDGCTNGNYGPFCDETCSCDQCDPRGKCPCETGYMGTGSCTTTSSTPSTVTGGAMTTSSTACPPGTLGPNCNVTCHCANVTSCPVCDVTGCDAGYQHISPNVTDCLQECSEGKYGEDCSQDCPSKCKTCDPVTGCTECHLGAGSLPECEPPPSAATPSLNPNSQGVGNTPTPDPEDPAGLASWIIYVMGGVAGLLVLILIILICVFVSRRRRQQRLKKKLDEYTVRDPVDEAPGPEDAQPTKNSLTVPADPRPASQVSGSDPVPEDYDLMPPEPPHDYSQPVAALEAHIKKVRQMEAMPFKEEYEKIPEGQTAPWDFGMKKNVHRDKNRFGNIVAYDHSRVLLTRKKDDASEYINANFVDGYKQAKAFIATQGPMPQTVNDFWRMCWEHEVPIIVMVTNCIENGRPKSEQYWPDNGQTKTAGDLSVYTDEEQIFSDFTIRTLHLKKGDDVRKIKQFQFTGWPDHGVPRQATPLLTLRRRVRAEMATKAGVTGPTVVHCSAGVGRSGTFMAVDYLKNQAESEGRIDVFGCVWRMRYQRVNMVQTWDQYNFIYDALLEAVTVGQTTIACYQFSEIYPEWLQSDPTTNINKLQQQLRILDVVKQNFPDHEFEAALKSSNKNKNRKEDILPATYYRPYLQTRVDGTTDYINAVFVQGYYKREAFLITQAPLPDTRVDFWRMVYDYSCTSVICLQDYKRTDSVEEAGDDKESFPPCWPEQGGTMNFGPLIVNNAKTVDDKGITTSELTLKVKKDKDVRQVMVFSVAEFPPNDQTPLPAKQQIGLKEAVKKWQQQSGDETVVVMCKYGVDRCGLYCALDYVIDMMDVEQDVDVFQAVRQVQMSRPQLVPNIEQFQFLYEAAQTYMDINMAYANFQ